NNYIGGHTATMDVEYGHQRYAVDTGFIVFNDWTYPNFIALLNELGVEWQYSDMSFSLRCERTGLEYNGTSINSLFAQRLNALRPSFLRMIHDILRFNDHAKQSLPTLDENITLSDFLKQGNYSAAFVERYIVPMGRSIWSASESAMLNFPARFFVDFFERHGFLNVDNRPRWRAIKGGSREYMKKLSKPFESQIYLNSAVIGVERNAHDVRVRTKHGDVHTFDYVVFACHSDQALRMLQKPSAEEQHILGAFPYQENEVLLHTDMRMLPRKPLARAAWNYHLLKNNQDRVALTYDMNVLQNLNAPMKFLVTLNRSDDIDPAKVMGRYTYDHPVYTPQAVAAQKQHSMLNGQQRSFYCGAYWRSGFHEDGVVSALNMLKDFARCIADDSSNRSGPQRMERAT
ncbi:MAG TPA: FAD-dependent oxidoreductase, partial [Steroidobacteraceae bacterium]|nr:FAD-dependent oxidoreductase [Steroidobacteraceae bacterium]